MNNREKIKELIDELCRFDPALKNQRASLEKLIGKLLLAKPDVFFNKVFRNELKQQILERIKKKKTPVESLWNIMPGWKKLVISGSFVAVLTIVPGVIYFSAFQSKLRQSSFSDQELSPSASSGFEIFQREEAAFGELKAVSPTSKLTENQGVGEMPNGSIPQNTAIDSAREMIAIPPYVPKSFVFSYHGENIRINQNKSEVLRRIKNLDLADFQSLISGFDDDLLNFESFSDICLQSLSFSEEKPYGLFVNLNTEDGSVTISQNWKQWNLDCVNGDCSRQEQLNRENFPADQLLITLADELIRNHGINMENFESGSVDQQWNSYLQENETATTTYIPEEVSVIYPLKIGERKIFNQSGTREGLRVQINVRLMRASGLYGLTTQKYESSLYETENDFLRLVEIAENKEQFYPASFDEMEEYPERYRRDIVELELDTPVFSFIKYWHYTDNESQELIVPALSFPIKNAYQNGYYQENIMVPLIKDMLQQE